MTSIISISNVDDSVNEVNQVSLGGVECFDDNIRTPLSKLFVPPADDIAQEKGTQQDEKCSIESSTASLISPSPLASTILKHPHTEQKKLIGVLGGVGPMAGVALQEKIINATKANTDQMHLSTLHFCCPSYIGDRTKWIVGGCRKDVPNPGDGMFEVARTMSIAAHAMGMSAVVGVPCNTFHADAIFSQFLRRVEEWNQQHNYSANSPGHLKVLHMIDLTLKSIKESGASQVGIMCTSGTRDSRLYDSIAENMGGVEIIHVAQDEQEHVSDAIYNQTDGIKALSRGSERVVEVLSHQVETLVKQQGAQAVILGCTELPLALPQPRLFGVRLVDPMNMLAEALVAEALGINTMEAN